MIENAKETGGESAFQVPTGIEDPGQTDQHQDKLANARYFGIVPTLPSAVYVGIFFLDLTKFSRI